MMMVPNNGTMQSPSPTILMPASYSFPQYAMNAAPSGVTMQWPMMQSQQHSLTTFVPPPMGTITPQQMSFLNAGNTSMVQQGGNDNQLGNCIMNAAGNDNQNNTVATSNTLVTMDNAVALTNGIAGQQQEGRIKQQEHLPVNSEADVTDQHVHKESEILSHTSTTEKNDDNGNE
jgi:hypothetical protein